MDVGIAILELDDGYLAAGGLWSGSTQQSALVKLDANGRGPDGCAYNEFMDRLSSDWEVTDEGPMEDLLGIEVDYLEDGAIKLHQERYIQKLVERYLPDGPSPKAQRGSLPYSGNFLQHVLK